MRRDDIPILPMEDHPKRIPYRGLLAAIIWIVFLLGLAVVTMRPVLGEESPNPLPNGCTTIIMCGESTLSVLKGLCNLIPHLESMPTIPYPPPSTLSTGRVETGIVKE